MSGMTASQRAQRQQCLNSWVSIHGKEPPASVIDDFERRNGILIAPPLARER